LALLATWVKVINCHLSSATADWEISANHHTSFF
jgi:hypothetical protein